MKEGENRLLVEWRDEASTIVKQKAEDNPRAVFSVPQSRKTIINFDIFCPCLEDP